LVAWVHPVTDIVGAVLLAVTALTAAKAADLGRWASQRRTKRVG
jgi:hypothetical protein